MLATSLVEVLQNKPRAAKMGIAGRQLLEKYYGVDAIAAKYERVYYSAHAQFTGNLARIVSTRGRPTIESKCVDTD